MRNYRYNDSRPKIEKPETVEIYFATNSYIENSDTLYSVARSVASDWHTAPPIHSPLDPPYTHGVSQSCVDSRGVRI